jgi:hypothetical protein
MVSHDVLWKGLIEDLAEDFLLFFYDDFVDLIDWSRANAPNLNTEDFL